MKAGSERAVIQQANLIPPTLANSSSEVHLAYLLIRENLINRVFQQSSGYWHNGLHGLDALSDADRGAILADYLNLSEGQIVSAAKRMMHGGHHEMAAAVLQWAHARWPDTTQINAARRLAYLKLMEKYQKFNPFKFIVYGGEARQSVVQINETPAGQ